MTSIECPIYKQGRTVCIVETFFICTLSKLWIMNHFFHTSYFLNFDDVTHMHVIYKVEWGKWIIIHDFHIAFLKHWILKVISFLLLWGFLHQNPKLDFRPADLWYNEVPSLWSWYYPNHCQPVNPHWILVVVSSWDWGGNQVRPRYASYLAGCIRKEIGVFSNWECLLREQFLSSRNFNEFTNTTQLGLGAVILQELLSWQEGGGGVDGGCGGGPGTTFNCLTGHYWAVDNKSACNAPSPQWEIYILH